MALEPVLERLEAAAVTPAWQALLEAVARDCHTSAFQVLRTALPSGWLGRRAPSSGGERKCQLAIPRHGDAPAAASWTPRQAALLTALQQTGPRPVAALVRQGWSRALVQTLAREGALTIEVGVPEGTPPQDPWQPPTAALPRLTPAQAEALATIAADPQQREWLLWGVTGSGKTEVYLRCAAQHLAAGRSVLLLTPEIGLVPQLLDRSRRRFGEAAVLAFHSGLRDSERTQAWRRCRRGSPLLVVGTRSAIFLPLPQLGLIVLDEEHDGSYKQDSPMPCYHTVSVARRRVQLQGCQLLLGSATPRLETWTRAVDPGGGLRMLQLPARIEDRPLPRVLVVDMRGELADGHRRLLSRPLLDRLAGLPERGEQAVVLVPRRGYSTFLSCRSCGDAVPCPHCDVSLTVHRRRDGSSWLRCHWCDHRQEVESRCGSCGSTAFRPFGAGTQRVVDQLAGELEGLRLLRFDRDSTRGRDGHERLLQCFAEGGADVLVGTQMLAKGMDLPRVTLAAVLAADGQLHRPDLRAAEETLQLLLQLAGRAGRGERPGEVIVQTYSPDHRVIRHLVDGRYGRFLDEEAALRRQAGLVPFARACLLRFAGPQASATASAAAGTRTLLEPGLAGTDWQAIGPAPAPRSRIAGLSRWQLLLHGPADSPLPLPPEADLRRSLPRGVHLTIDPDPLEL
jgi:primosomal protein N' (replication factor Y)